MDDRVKMSTHNKVLQFIALLRDSCDLSIVIYTSGGCFKLYQMLKLFFPKAEVWYDGQLGHVYTKIGRFFYDINGSYPLNYTVRINHKWYKLETEPLILNQAKDWKCSYDTIKQLIKEK